MRILVAHNRYQQTGGEDSVVAEETAMLERHGHEVAQFIVNNDDIAGAAAQIGAAVRAFYSSASRKKVEEVLASFKPDVLHVHNFFPTLSPSVYFAARGHSVPVVQTLHNYRLVCANAQLFRDGRPCEDCLQSKSFFPGVKYACYRGSRAGSAVVGGVMSFHAALGTWERRIDRYVVLTEFAAAKLGEWRVPRERVRVKPNFVPDRGIAEGKGGFALFVGRLSHEKGLSVLIEADRMTRLPLPVYIAGDGPMRQEVEQAAARPGSRIKVLGPQSREQVLDLMRAATVLLVPSIWYEGFPMVLAEALSFGLPVIASRIGGLPEIVEHGKPGLLFEARNASAFVEALRKILGDADLLSSMRQAARQRFEDLYSEERNHAMLMTIYQEAFADASRA